MAFGEHCESNLCAFLTQLGPVTLASVQANHTSAVGQVEAINFTIVNTTMSTGCHIQVRKSQVSQVCSILCWGGLIEMCLLNVSYKLSCLRVLPCLHPGSACSIMAPTTATFATSCKADMQSCVHVDWQR